MDEQVLVGALIGRYIYDAGADTYEVRNWLRTVFHGSSRPILAIQRALRSDTIKSLKKTQLQLKDSHFNAEERSFLQNHSNEKVLINMINEISDVSTTSQKNLDDIIEKALKGCNALKKPEEEVIKKLAFDEVYETLLRQMKLPSIKIPAGYPFINQTLADWLVPKILVEAWNLWQPQKFETLLCLVNTSFGYFLRAAFYGIAARYFVYRVFSTHEKTSYRQSCQALLENNFLLDSKFFDEFYKVSGEYDFRSTYKGIRYPNKRGASIFKPLASVFTADASRVNYKVVVGLGAIAAKVAIDFFNYWSYGDSLQVAWPSSPGSFEQFSKYVIPLPRYFEGSSFFSQSVDKIIFEPTTKTHKMELIGQYYNDGNTLREIEQQSCTWTVSIDKNHIVVTVKPEKGWYEGPTIFYKQKVFKIPATLLDLKRSLNVPLSSFYGNYKNQEVSELDAETKAESNPAVTAAAHYFVQNVKFNDANQLLTEPMSRQMSDVYKGYEKAIKAYELNPMNFLAQSLTVQLPEAPPEAPTQNSEALDLEESSRSVSQGSGSVGRQPNQQGITINQLVVSVNRISEQLGQLQRSVFDTRDLMEKWERIAQQYEKKSEAATNRIDELKKQIDEHKKEKDKAKKAHKKTTRELEKTKKDLAVAQEQFRNATILQRQDATKHKEELEIANNATAVAKEQLSNATILQKQVATNHENEVEAKTKEIRSLKVQIFKLTRLQIQLNEFFSDETSKLEKCETDLTGEQLTKDTCEADLKEAKLKIQTYNQTLESQENTSAECENQLTECIELMKAAQEQTDDVSSDSPEVPETPETAPERESEGIEAAQEQTDDVSSDSPVVPDNLIENARNALSAVGDLLWGISNGRTSDESSNSNAKSVTYADLRP